MKRILIIVIMLGAAIGLQARDHSVEQLIYKYKEKKHVEYVHVPKLVLRLGTKVMGKGSKSEKDSLRRDMMQRISSVSVLNLSRCKGSVRRKFAHDMKHLDTQTYQPVAQTSNNGRHLMLLTHMQGEYIDELLVLNDMGRQCLLIRVKGKFRPDEMQQLAGEEIGEDILGD